jgi:molybdate transport system substrate-binding protein
MTRRTPFLILAALASGCGASSRTDPTIEPLRIAAASDLQAVMPVLIERFQAATGVQVEATFGASGQLSQQIKQGAPFDVFLSANRKFVADLAEVKAIDAQTVRDYAVGVLVLVVRDDLAGRVKSLSDLNDPSVKKLAIANSDTAPYGAAARQALERSGLWDALEPKRVQSETVRQALQFVTTGNAEAAIVGSAIAKVEGVRIVPIDRDKYDTMWQALGVTTTSKRPADALAFTHFMLGSEAQGILRGAGFGLRSDFPE